MLYRRSFLSIYVLYFLRRLRFSAPKCLVYRQDGPWSDFKLLDNIREIPEEVGDLTKCLRFLPLKQGIISPFNTDRLGTPSD